MKKFFIPIACVFVIACGTSQEATKETTKETAKKSEITESIKKDPIVSSTKKAIDTVIKTAVPDTTKAVPVMKKHAPPAPQIMKIPKVAPSVEGTAIKSVESTASKTAKITNTTKTIDHTPWNRLLQKHVTADGVVNYQGFKSEKTAFKAYLKTLSTTVPQSNWTTNQKLAYWMNAYNAFTIKLIVDHYPIKSIKDVKKPWDLRFFQIGKKWYNLNEIEHQILRKMGDARIHFGINCASFSCPPLLNKAFTTNNVNDTLEQLAVAFVNDKKRNEISPDAIKISKIFQWFGKDFKTKGTLIDFLNTYSKTKINPNASKGFLDYNWSLNE